MARRSSTLCVSFACLATVAITPLVSAGVALPLQAAETKTYTYDALGRLVLVEHEGASNNGVKVEFDYDDSGNRTNLKISISQVKFIVVPLNGYKLIPIPN